MPVVLLVRHGQASWQAEDYDVLSELGHEQGRVVGAELLRRKLRAPVVVSGSLNRQRDTAAAAGLEFTVDACWDEYDHLKIVEDHGDASFDGSPRSLQAMLDRALAEWIATASPDGWVAFHSRVHAGLTSLASGLESGQDAVVFTSGGVIAAITAQLLGAGPGAVVTLNRACINGSITKLALGRGGASLLTFNEHAHLEGALVTYR